MQQFKDRWEISQNWQLIHPFLGIIASLFSGYLLAKKITTSFSIENEVLATSLLTVFTVLLTYLLIKISLWFFKKLENRWKVNYRWEFIAIFLCFAVTGSSAGRISNPLMEFIGLPKETTMEWVYWPVRILLIFPIYQILLVIFGWIFGQFTFFKAFAQKMMSRMGLDFIFKK